MIPYIHEVKYYECDRMGVTHHSNYIRFMEEARVYVQDQLGYGFEKMEAEGVVSPVTALSCEFKKTTTFKDKIEINLKVKEQSPLKITFSYVMKVGDAVVFKGTSTHCFIDTASGRPVVMQERWPELFAKLQDL